MARYVLDTNAVTQIIKKNLVVLGHLRAALVANDEVLLCPVAYYEVKRGLLERQASRQLEDLDRLAGVSAWTDLDRLVWEDAAVLWAERRRRGEPHDDDADLLIGAFSRMQRASLVTNNTRHFQHMALRLVDWEEA